MAGVFSAWISALKYSVNRDHRSCRPTRQIEEEYGRMQHIQLSNAPHELETLKNSFQRKCIQQHEAFCMHVFKQIILWTLWTITIIEDPPWNNPGIKKRVDRNLIHGNRKVTSKKPKVSRIAMDACSTVFPNWCHGTFCTLCSWPHFIWPWIPFFSASGINPSIDTYDTWDEMRNTSKYNEMYCITAILQVDDVSALYRITSFCWCFHHFISTIFCFRPCALSISQCSLSVFALDTLGFWPQGLDGRIIPRASRLLRSRCKLPSFVKPSNRVKPLFELVSLRVTLWD